MVLPKRICSLLLLYIIVSTPFRSVLVSLQRINLAPNMKSPGKSLAGTLGLPTTPTLPTIPERESSPLILNQDNLKVRDRKVSMLSTTSATVLQAKVSLKQSLGLFNAVSVIVGIIIGSGIFISPKGVLIHSGSVGLSLIVWGASGCLALIGGLCYIELGVLMPVAGGDYHYIQKNYGPLLGFLYAWTQVFIVFPTGNAAVSLTFAKYFLQPIFGSCSPPANLEIIVAAVAILLLSIINCASVKWASRVQDFFSVAKVLALCVIIAFGIMSLLSPRSNFPKEVDDAFADSRVTASAISLAFYQGIYSFAGFNYLNFLMGEIKQPERNLPLAIFISMPLITLIYVMANVAYFSVLTPFEMLETEATALTFAERTLGSFSWVMSLFVSLSCFGGLNGAILSSSRMFFAAASRGHLPDVLSMIHVTQSTPMPAIIFESLLSIAMLMVKDVYALINYLTFAEFLFVGVAITVIPYLRWKEPNLKRPVSVPLPLAVIFILICGFLIIVPLIDDPATNGWGIAIIATGIPIYWFGVLWKPEDKPILIQETMRDLTVATQKLLVCVPEDEVEFTESEDK